MSVNETTRAYFSYLKSYRWYYAAGILMMVATSLSETIVPKFSQWTVDLLINRDLQVVPAFFRQSTAADTLNKIMILFLITMVLGWLGRIGWRQTFARRTHHAGYIFKKRFWESLHDQPLETFHRYHLGDLMNRSNADWNNARFIHGFTMVLTFDVLFVMLLSIIAMLQIDVGLTIACVIIMPILPQFIKKLLDKEAFYHGVAQEKLSHLTQLISQAIHTIRLQRATASETIWEKKLAKEAQGYAEKRYDVIRTGRQIFPITALPTLIAVIILLTWGLYKVIHRQLSIGELLALQSYVILLQTPLFELGDVLSEWQTGFTSFRRLTEIFALGQKKTIYPQSESIEVKSPDIVINGVKFQYAGHELPVLHHMALTVRRGQHIGLTGHIGAGKSTLASLISGLVPMQDGSIHLWGYPIDQMSPSVLRSQVLLVPQKAFLFSGTIRSNLSLDREFNDTELWKILDIVQMTTEVQQMPKQLDAYIGEWGLNLSGGQKQRLALARALLHPKSLLIMDDCLSAVDVATEEHIISGMNRLLQDSTVIWIAHRLSTLRSCDTIYELKDGNLHLVTGEAEI